MAVLDMHQGIWKSVVLAFGLLYCLYKPWSLPPPTHLPLGPPRIKAALSKFLSENHAPIEMRVVC